ncbi:MAG: ribbon-helix-helix protein, CopG family [Verrucomicrobia bacterium]|nr:ribbon-helix-helix protein, CopG family [Verrucomicrobiota bacterium]
MTTLSVKLPDKLAAAVERAAKARRTTSTAFVRETLAEKTATPSPKKGASLLERTKNLCGIAASGMGDLKAQSKFCVANAALGNTPVSFLQRLSPE